MNQQRQAMYREYFEKCLKEMNDFESYQDEIQVKGDNVDQFFFERNKQLLQELVKKQKIFKNDVEQALTRLEEGSFGQCMECGIEIDEGRLKANPAAHNCIHCQEELEREQKQYGYQAELA